MNRNTRKQRPSRLWYLLLVLPFIAMFWVSSHNSGVWIIQTLPAVIGGLYTRWFHDRALVLGWLAGIVAGTAMAASQSFRPIYPLQIGALTIPTYAALASLILNLIVVIALTPVFNAIHAVCGEDETRAEHYV